MEFFKKTRSVHPASVKGYLTFFRGGEGEGDEEEEWFPTTLKVYKLAL